MHDQIADILCEALLILFCYGLWKLFIAIGSG